MRNPTISVVEGIHHKCHAASGSSVERHPRPRSISLSAPRMRTKWPGVARSVLGAGGFHPLVESPENPRTTKGASARTPRKIQVDTLARLGGNDLDGDAVDRLVAGEFVDEVSRREQIRIHTRVFPCNRKPSASFVMTPTVGKRHNAAHHLIADFNGNFDRTRFACDASV